jgi:hypothetical protein
VYGFAELGACEVSPFLKRAVNKIGLSVEGGVIKVRLLEEDCVQKTAI